MKATALRGMATAAVLWTACVASAGRYEDFTRKAAEGPHATPVAATFFGSGGIEEFVAAGTRPDGTIVAFGNAWGPEFVSTPRPTVLGRGQRYGQVNEFVGGRPEDNRGRPAGLDSANPNIAGMIVQYSPDLSRVLRVTRLDWGIGTITHGLVLPDGRLVIAGRATEAMRQLGQSAPVRNGIVVPAGRNVGPYDYQGVTVSGDAYLAGLNAEATQLEWIWILQGHRQPGGLYLDHAGNLVLDCQGLRRFSTDGRRTAPIEGAGGGGRMLAVSPVDGLILRGGHNNPGTGREPWWRPYVNGFSSTGEHLWEIYAWDGRLVGHDRYRLVSDSYVRGGAVDDAGNLIISGSSDGGNSVYNRSPVDLDRGTGVNNFGMSAWGMGVGQAAYLIRIEPQKFEVLNSSTWLTYLPDNFESANVRGRPNSVWIHHVQPLRDGSVAFAGSAATGLIETPNALFRYPGDGRRFGGNYAAIFSPGFDRLWYSGYLPAVDVQGLGRTPRGAIVVGRSRGEDDNANPSPTRNAPQAQFGGGQFDAYILLLNTP